LQVEADNGIAYHLYEHLGFRAERTWTQWRRSSNVRAPQPFDHPAFYITRRRPNEWRSEYALAQRVRPAWQGGIGWLRPLHPSLFHRSLFNRLRDLLSFRQMERLIIREDDEISAAMWVESAFAASSIQLTLMVEPDADETYAEALINLAARRYSLHSALTMEHPTDDARISSLLQRYQFHPQRTLTHMRWEAG
jgi:hypothetical protein